jgi:S-DNA-T family DNA segregation ATPase FtsK/SpoIIIE
MRKLYTGSKSQGRDNGNKTRMKVSTRTSSVNRRRTPEPDLSHRPSDILGVVIISLAVIVAVSLALASNTGIAGQALSSVLKTLFGRGAWAVPFVLGGLGYAVLAGRRSVGISHLTLGLALIFLSLLGAFARPVGQEYFDPRAISESGGYLGAIIGWTAEALLGSAKLVGLGALAMIGIVLCVNVPLRSLLEAFGQRSRELRERPVRPVREPMRRAVVEAPDDAPAAAPETKRLKPAPIFKDRQQTRSLNTVTESMPKEGYQLPPLGLLAEPAAKPKRTPQEMQRNIETLESTLEEFGIDANVVEVATGPTVTRYEIQLGPGIRVARITSLADNIAMNLAASQVRVEAPIPGKSAIGVEVPNTSPTPVSLREVCEADEFKNHPSRLCIALGQDVSGITKYADLTKMPHLLIGGATNSGKSIGLASLITSLLMRNTPKDLRLVMIDPKRVELTLFDGIPHLMCPVIKDVKETPGVLRAIWREMDRRYDLLSAEGVRNIQSWNEKASFQDKLPYIVVIIDELADLMIQAAAEVETSIVRLAQLARAVGIHLVIATQRPSVDVITGTIKANIPSRIAFSVASQIDSRTILDQKGAEALIGKGDMLYMPIDASKPVRVQGCYVGEKEIEAICAFWRAQESPAYVFDPAEFKEEGGSGKKGERGATGDEDVDPLWEESVRWCAERGQASTSMLQRRFSIGFQRASRLLDQMEERGIVGPRDGPRPRDVLVSIMDVDSLFGQAPVYETGWLEDED